MVALGTAKSAAARTNFVGYRISLYLIICAGHPRGYLHANRKMRPRKMRVKGMLMRKVPTNRTQHMIHLWI